jgi:hypothetical protein
MLFQAAGSFETYIGFGVNTKSGSSHPILKYRSGKKEYQKK